MKRTLKTLSTLSLISTMLFFSCNTSTISYLEKEFGIKLSGKIKLEVKKDINFGFSGDFTTLRIFSIKENFYDEIEQAAINKNFIDFNQTNPLPLEDDIFSEYINNTTGKYKFYNDNHSEYELIILNKKAKLIIYYFGHN